MILDTQNQFSSGQAITASAASTNVIDLGVARDIGKGQPIPLLIQVTEDFATLTSLKVAVQTDDNEAFNSATTVLETEAIAAASLLEGYRFNIDAIPSKTKERYVRLYFTVAGSNATTGKITAGIVAGLQDTFHQ